MSSPPGRRVAGCSTQLSSAWVGILSGSKNVSACYDLTSLCPAIRAFIRLRLHVGAQNGVNTGLVAAALLLEPFHNIMVNPDCQAVLRLRHGELRGLPKRLTQLGNVGVVDVRIAHLAQAFEVSLALGPRPWVVCVILPFIAMCP